MAKMSVDPLGAIGLSAGRPLQAGNSDFSEPSTSPRGATDRPSERAQFVNSSFQASGNESLAESSDAPGDDQVLSRGDVSGGAGVWSSALENLKGAEESRKAIEELLRSDRTVFVDERAFRSIASTAEAVHQIKAQQKRIETLQQELRSAVVAAADAKVALRQSEQSRAVLQERLQQIEKELEATSGVFEVYTTELRARQLEVEKRCEEVRVLQAIVRNLSGNNPKAVEEATQIQIQD